MIELKKLFINPFQRHPSIDQTFTELVSIRLIIIDCSFVDGFNLLHQ